MVDYFVHKQEQKRYKEQQLRKLRRAGARIRGGSGLGAERRQENGEDWFETPSGENLLMDRS